MLKKIDNCIFCKKELQEHTSKKRYCSVNCRVYYNRELKKLNKPKRVEIYYTEPIEIFTKENKDAENGVSKVDKLRLLRENK